MLMERNVGLARFGERGVVEKRKQTTFAYFLTLLCRHLTWMKLSNSHSMNNRGVQEFFHYQEFQKNTPQNSIPRTLENLHSITQTHSYFP